MWNLREKSLSCIFATSLMSFCLSFLCLPLPFVHKCGNEWNLLGMNLQWLCIVKSGFVFLLFIVFLKNLHFDLEAALPLAQLSFRWCLWILCEWRRKKLSFQAHENVRVFIQMKYRNLLGFFFFFQILWANSEKKITFHTACSKSYEFLPRAFMRKFCIKRRCKLAERVKQGWKTYPSISHHYIFYHNLNRTIKTTLEKYLFSSDQFQIEVLITL